MVKKGVIYILTNPSFPEYVKIGYTDDINKRLMKLEKCQLTDIILKILNFILA